QPEPYLVVHVGELGLLEDHLADDRLEHRVRLRDQLVELDVAGSGPAPHDAAQCGRVELTQRLPQLTTKVEILVDRVVGSRVPTRMLSNYHRVPNSRAQ